MPDVPIALKYKVRLHMKKVCYAFLSFIFTICLTQIAYGWTGSGHRWVAGIAWDHMTPEAQETIHNLLISGQDIPECEKDIISNTGNKKKAFVGAASWSDCVRGKPGFGMYHADRYPLCLGLGRSACKSKHCASDSLLEAIKNLGDPSISQEIRRRAVKTIIHLVGDLHQPLHVVATGPIDMMIRKSAISTPSRLHEYWDYDVMVGVKEKQKALFDLIKTQGTAMQQGTWNDWINETVAQGKKMAYGELLGGEAGMCTAIQSVGNLPVVLPPEYANKASDLGIIKIAQAGMRLAKIFNQTTSELNNASQAPVKIGNISTCQIDGTAKDSFCYSCKDITHYQQNKDKLKTAEATCLTIAGNFSSNMSISCNHNQSISNQNGTLTCEDNGIQDTLKKNSNTKQLGNVSSCIITGSVQDSFCYTCKDIITYQENNDSFKSAEASCKTIYGNYIANTSAQCTMQQSIANINGILTCEHINNDEITKDD